MANLPANLPENWTSGMIIAPNGADVGYQEQYGYNYLNKQVNDAQKAINNIGTTLEDVAKEVDVIEIKNRIGTLMVKSNKLIDGIDLLKKTVIGVSTNGGVLYATLSRIRGTSSDKGTVHYKTYKFTSLFRNQHIKRIVFSPNLAVKINRLALEIDGITSIDAKGYHDFNIKGSSVYLNMRGLSSGGEDYIHVADDEGTTLGRYEPLSFVYTKTATITLEIEQRAQGALDMELGAVVNRI